MKAMFTVTVFEILLFEGRSALWPAHRVTGSKRVKISVKNQKKVGLLLELFEKWLSYKLRRFWMVLNIFLILLDPFSTGKIEKLDFWDSSNSITLNINNYRTTSEKSINLDVIRKLIEYSLKMFFLWRQFLLLPFSRYCCSKVGWYYHPPSELQGAKELT